jgi:predicted transcriptional regulator
MEDSEALVIYWHEKGHDARTIHRKLSARAGRIGPGYSTVTNWIRRLVRNEDITRRAFGSGRLPDTRIDALIADA